MTAIDAMLREELDVPRKQRHTARRVCARLSDEHGAKELPYSTVRDYARLREARDLFTSMNQRILAAAAPDAAGDAGIDAWTQLGEVSVPVLCTWGEFDLHCDMPFYKETARRISQSPGRILGGVAHLPGLEQPQLIAELIRDALHS